MTARHYSVERSTITPRDTALKVLSETIANVLKPKHARKLIVHLRRAVEDVRPEGRDDPKLVKLNDHRAQRRDPAGHAAKYEYTAACYVELDFILSLIEDVTARAGR